MIIERVGLEDGKCRKTVEATLAPANFEGAMVFSNSVSPR